MSGIKLTVTIYTSSHQELTIWPGSHGEGLYNDWVKSGDEADFELLASWIEDDVRDQLEFEIENVEV